MKSFKQYLKEDNFNLDAWLKELMQDSKRNYGYVDLDYVMMSLGYETPKKYSEKEIADRIKKLGFGSILRESTWTDYYDKIVDLDLDTKTMTSKYKNRKDLESAAAKKYGWNVQSEPFKTAFDKYFNESAKALKESLSGVSRTSDVIKTLDVFQTNISTKIKSLKDVVNKRNHKEVERLGESILADAKKLDKFLNAVAEDLEYDNIA